MLDLPLCALAGLRPTGHARGIHGGAERLTQSRMTADGRQLPQIRGQRPEDRQRIFAFSEQLVEDGERDLRFALADGVEDLENVGRATPADEFVDKA